MPFQGTFKGWLKGKPFGFISPDDGSGDVFLHHAKLEILPRYRPVAVLQFEILETERGRQASNVEILAETKTPVESEGPAIATDVEGLVVSWSDAGYGFIQTERFNEDVFVHYSGLVLSEDGYLSEGDVVKFDAVEGQKGIVAKNVEAIGWRAIGGPLTQFADMGNPRWLSRLREWLRRSRGFTGTLNHPISSRF